ncbi:MAG TPA: site-specific integrase [Nitrospiraceae bacterium]
MRDEELIRLRNVLPLWAWVCFAIESGLRLSEQFGLRWDCVNLENGVLTVPLSKSGKTRPVPASEEARMILRSFDSFATSPFVFPSVHDPLKSLNLDSMLRNVFRPALRKAGIQGCVWHSLRHTAASRRVAAGADLYAVKEFLGHADYETTLKYSHRSLKHLRDTANLGSLGGLLHSGAGTVAGSVATGEESAAERVQPLESYGAPGGT